MPLPRRAKLEHIPPNWVKGCPIFFITVCAAERGKNQFCEPGIADAIFKAVAFYQVKQRWYVQLLLLMPDHLHALISFPPDQTMESVIRAWKHFLAKQHGIHWQRDFFDHRIRQDESHEEKTAYIRSNPVRAGLVTKPEDWPYVWEPPR